MAWLGHAANPSGIYGQVFRDIGELFAPIDLALEVHGISESDFRVMQHGEMWSPQ